MSRLLVLILIMINSFLPLGTVESIWSLDGPSVEVYCSNTMPLYLNYRPIAIPVLNMGQDVYYPLQDCLAYLGYALKPDSNGQHMAIAPMSLAEVRNGKREFSAGQGMLFSKAGRIEALTENGLTLLPYEPIEKNAALQTQEFMDISARLQQMEFDVGVGSEVLIVYEFYQPAPSPHVQAASANTLHIIDVFPYISEGGLAQVFTANLSWQDEELAVSLAFYEGRIYVAESFLESSSYFGLTTFQGTNIDCSLAPVHSLEDVLIREIGTAGTEVVLRVEQEMRDADGALYEPRQYDLCFTGEAVEGLKVGDRIDCLYWQKRHDTVPVNEGIDLRLSSAE